MSYLPHVDGLRALAVALVVIFHAWPTALPGGFIGVDVFFVISGFIITRQLAVEMQHGTFSYLAFLGRRLRRLVPAAFVCCLIVTVAALVILMPDALEEYSKSLIAAWTMTANIYFYRNTGYFDAPAAEAPLLHMWSLAVEDQFYLTWPLLLLVLFRGLVTRPRIAAAALALGVISLLHAEHIVGKDPSFAFYLPMSRAFELLAGCALALIAPHMNPSARVLPLLDVAGLVLVVASAFLISAETPFPGLSALPVVAGSVLLIAAGLYRETPVSRVFSQAPVVLTGRMSYSIYLYHWPVLALAAYWLGRGPNAVEAAFLVALALALAALSWLLVEQRLTRTLGMYEMAPAVLVRRTLSAIAALCVLAAVGVAGEGLPQRLDRPAYEVYSAASSSNPRRQSCDGHDRALRRDGRCTFGKPLEDGRSYDIAVFGDSNADHFVPMLDELATKAGLSGRQVTHSACAPLIGASAGRAPFYENECERFQRVIPEFLDANPDLKIAVLAAAWGGYNDPLTNAIATDAERQRTFAEFARETVALFRKRGIEVMILGQIPHFEAFSLRCLADAARRDMQNSECTVPRSDVDATLSVSQQAFAALAASDAGVTFLDIRNLLCDERVCSAFKDGVLVYRDRGHLNAIGSAYLARYATLPAVAP